MHQVHGVVAKHAAEATDAVLCEEEVRVGRERQQRGNHTVQNEGVRAEIEIFERSVRVLAPLLPALCLT